MVTRSAIRYLVLVGLALTFTVIVTGVTQADPAIIGRASVVDGDTIEIRGARIRLWGIDAPEGNQRCVRNGKAWRCGTDAANALSDFLAARTVACQQQDRDRYRRIVATCELDGQDVGAWLVREGWALDYTRYSKGAYEGEQIKAKAAERGLWQGGVRGTLELAPKSR